MCMVIIHENGNFVKETFEKVQFGKKQFSIYLRKLILYYNGKKSQSFNLKFDQAEVIQSMNLP